MHCFLDRDGVFNYDHPYIGTINRFHWHPHIIPILKVLKVLGYKLVLITNQSGISRGYFTLADFYDLSFYLLDVLSYYDLDLEINFCPHLPSDNCLCRKPMPGMIQRYGVTSRDIFIGNSSSDMQAAQNASILKRWIIADHLIHPATHSFSSHSELLSFMLSNSSFL